MKNTEKYVIDRDGKFDVRDEDEDGVTRLAPGDRLATTDEIQAAKLLGEAIGIASYDQTRRTGRVPWR